MSKPRIQVYDYLGREVKGAKVMVEQIDGHKVANLTAPGYLRDRVILDFNDSAEVMLLVDPKTATCDGVTPGFEVETLMATACRYLGAARYLFSPAVKTLDDRAYWECRAGLLVQHLNRSGVWSSDKNKGKGHKYEEGWERIGSWRSNTHVVSMQAVAYRREVSHTINTEGYGKPVAKTEEMVVELDLDYGGLKHIGQVLGNWVKKKKSHPVEMAQSAAYYWGLKLPFEIRPGEEGADEK